MRGGTRGTRGGTVSRVFQPRSPHIMCNLNSAAAGRLWTAELRAARLYSSHPSRLHAHHHRRRQARRRARRRLARPIRAPDQGCKQGLLTHDFFYILTVLDKKLKQWRASLCSALKYPCSSPLQGIAGNKEP
jgi:hypothetical protein